MSTSELVGEQLDGKVLYERQKQRRATHAITPAPTIVAIGLEVSENIGGVLRLADAAGSPRAIFVSAAAHDVKRIRRAARHSDALVAWEFCAPDQFTQCIPSLQPLIALELTTHSTNIFETRLPDQCAIVIGNEQHGIPSPVLGACQQAV
ncbi:MAG: TrmH family RNA methyltransferase, partial [Chloroflexota bacterium]